MEETTMIKKHLIQLSLVTLLVTGIAGLPTPTYATGTEPDDHDDAMVLGEINRGFSEAAKKLAKLLLDPALREFSLA
jgi:hypothetical protein